MKIYVICGAGVGTSLLLKMNVEKALSELSIPKPYEVLNTSVSLAKSINADLIYSFESFVPDLKHITSNIIVIDNLMDVEEIKKKTREYFKI